jgi:hypothetical protein
MRPSEFKTPPPPFYGEESDDDYDPREAFYNMGSDPNANKFDYLDSKTRRMLRERKQKTIDAVNKLKSVRRRQASERSSPEPASLMKKFPQSLASAKALRTVRSGAFQRVN